MAVESDLLHDRGIIEASNQYSVTEGPYLETDIKCNHSGFPMGLESLDVCTRLNLVLFARPYVPFCAALTAGCEQSHGQHFVRLLASSGHTQAPV